MQTAGLATSSDVSGAIESVFSGGAAWMDTQYIGEMVRLVAVYVFTQTKPMSACKLESSPAATTKNTFFNQPEIMKW